jgi:hypothetical protein
MTQLVPIPPEIAALALKLAVEGRVWKYAEFRCGRDSYFKQWEDLSVGDCEQLAEQYGRLARKAIERYMMTGSRCSAKTAATYIDRARLYRDRYHELTGQPPDEHDQVFPLLSVDEAPQQRD